MTLVPEAGLLGDYLGLALDRLGDGVTVQDASGALVYANDAGARLCGFDSAEQLLRTPVEEVVGQFELFDEHDRPLAVADLPGRRALAGEHPPELLVQRPHVLSCSNLSRNQLRSPGPISGSASAKSTDAFSNPAGLPISWRPPWCTTTCTG